MTDDKTPEEQAEELRRALKANATEFDRATSEFHRAIRHIAESGGAKVDGILHSSLSYGGMTVTNTASFAGNLPAVKP